MYDELVFGFFWRLKNKLYSSLDVTDAGAAQDVHCGFDQPTDGHARAVGQLCIGLFGYVGGVLK